VELAPEVRAVGGYRHEGTARRVLLGAKLGGRRAVLPVLGALLAARLPLPAPGPGLAWTSVPPSAATRRRGVDVPAALAAHAGGRATRLLRANRVGAAGQAQTGRTAASRRAGAQNRYTARGPVPAAVVLVDDVRTTGATATAAARALQVAGARRVLVVTFSVAVDPTTGR
jgi:predicted amidophosphoribosyltransferase